MSHDELSHLAAAYALSALEPEEAVAFQEHLSTCEECSRQVAEMLALAGALPLVVAERDAPIDLRRRVLSAVSSESTKEPVERRTPGRWYQFLLRPVTVAAAMVVLLSAVAGLTVWNVLSEDDNIPFAQLRIDRGYEGINIMARAEEWWRFSGTEAAPSASSALAYSGHHSAACLVVWGLPTEDGQSYQA